MVTKKILLLGAYGNFGRHITDKLAPEPDLHLVLAGRSKEKCETLAQHYQAVKNPPLIEVFDIHHEFEKNLARIKPDLVIHTCGPFQGQHYTIAKACIEQGCHYLDLADGREFVSNISQLNEKAMAKQVSIISGASSVPCLTAAVLDHFLPQFATLTAVDSGIATAQRINVGLATISGTLSYAGKPFQMLKDGKMHQVYGWQNMKCRVYPQLGRRYLCHCDVPDLALFPQRYPTLTRHEFRVSLEVPLVHWVMWGLSWLVRFKLLPNLSSWAPSLRNMAHWFDRWGSNDSGFHVAMQGLDHEGKKKMITYYLIALDRYGPYIPSMPAILCAKKLLRGEIQKRGAYPCVGLINLAEYLAALDTNKIITETAIEPA